MRSEGHTLEMHHIRYFLALSETLNLTKAAERCNVSQPALSRAIKALETGLAGDGSPAAAPALASWRSGARCTASRRTPDQAHRARCHAPGLWPLTRPN